MARPLAHGEPDSAQVFPPLLCAAAMKTRAPGSQLAARTAWMLGFPNPKLGACKFTPALQGTGGSARDGWLCHEWETLLAGRRFGPYPARYDRDGAVLPSAGLAALLP